MTTTEGSGEVKFGLISDTHGFVHPLVHDLFAGVQCILHAGDVCGDDVLRELELIAPVFAVCGNNDDVSPILPWRRVVDLPFGRVGIVHGHQQPVDGVRRTAALTAAFLKDDVRVILYGHSHIYAAAHVGNTWIINPGAASRPRFQARPSVCILRWNPSHPDQLTHDLISLPWPPNGARQSR